MALLEVFALHTGFACTRVQVKKAELAKSALIMFMHFAEANWQQQQETAVTSARKRKRTPGVSGADGHRLEAGTSSTALLPVSLVILLSVLMYDIQLLQ